MCITDIAGWQIASFRCGVEFGCYQGIAEIGHSPHQSSSIYDGVDAPVRALEVASTGVHFQRPDGPFAGWKTLTSSLANQAVE
jgi:hypothetical protein